MMLLGPQIHLVPFDNFSNIIIIIQDTIIIYLHAITNFMNSYTLLSK